MSKLIAEAIRKARNTYASTTASARNPSIKKIAAIVTRAIKAGAPKGGAPVAPGVHISGGCITVTAFVRGLDGFKDKRLMKCLGILLDAAPGLDVKSSNVDDLSYGSRDFTFRFLSEGREVGHVVIYAVLSGAPKNCRIVEVGRRKVEVEEIDRKFVCDEEVA